ncbi:plasmid mobilization relaxosome protein MobC [Pedobacter sp. KBS0701]|uniref:plasmid mobilization protein n=1 Tax=Pedobacter sp. KBS0701 TaxID=2578106 RepID=UPI00110F3616|nr:plasmid mobilization relaxosome protein MobC [Pedobacter sp. KBS0701]QDW24740.1 plasmid mobilization relaxosome protein MobC [Pedobacter sp. KBS0701]
MSSINNDKRRKNFDYPIRTRVNKETYQRLENLLAGSTCQSMGELTRKLIIREKISCTHRDVTMNAPMEQLTNIRKELKAIGININQITRTFNHLSVSHSFSRTENKVLIAIFYSLTDQPCSLKQFNQLFVNGNYFKFG